METERWRRRTVSVIEGYLSGAITRKEASDWALGAIVSIDADEFPEEVAMAVHMLFDLHDGDSCWVPGIEEFEYCKDQLVTSS